MRPVCMCVRSVARWRTRRHSSNPCLSDQVRPYLTRIVTEDIAAVATEAYEVVEEEQAQ
jgi:hypothetical protein